MSGHTFCSFLMLWNINKASYFLLALTAVINTCSITFSPSLDVNKTNKQKKKSCHVTVKPESTDNVTPSTTLHFTNIFLLLALD